MLESVEESKRWGRYTFLGFDPVLELTCRDGLLRIKGATTVEQQVEHPGDAIRKILAENKSPKLPGLPTFTGGLVGYFAYDYIKYAEPTLKLEKGDEDSFQDVDLMLFDKVIAFDNFRQKIILIVNMKTDAPEQEYYKAQMELDKLVNLIRTGKPAPEQPLKLKGDFKPVFSEEAYCEMVEKGKQYIREGDIFQVVLSNQLEAEMEGSLLDAYRVLRTSNPSPTCFIFPAMTLKSRVLLQKHWSSWKMGNSSPIRWPEPGREARHRRRMSGWSRNFSLMKKNGLSTICWWIWDGMTLERSARLVL